MRKVEIFLSDRECAEIEQIGRLSADGADGAAPVPLDEMAQALLQSHLILIRDCGAILPAGRTGLPRVAHGKAGGKLKGKGGVSLSGGADGRV